MMRLLLGLILIASAWPAFSADSASLNAPLFRVELIVFENLDPAAVQAEQWPVNPGAPPLNHAMELKDLTAAGAAAESTDVPSGTAATPASAAVQAAPAPAAAEWRWLTPPQLRLIPAEQKLAASGRYRLLLHVGWVQPLENSEHGTPVHIYDGMAPSELPAAASPAPNTVSSTQESQHLLDGTFTLWRGRFLHADLDLGYRLTYLPQPKVPAAPTAVTPADLAAKARSAAAPQPVSLYVRMTQSRRLRGGELHYLDHPLFGVLVTVSPYEDTSAASRK